MTAPGMVPLGAGGLRPAGRERTVTLIVRCACGRPGDREPSLHLAFP
jgi:hypothetical protein